ncbi:MAG: hypothetical protein H8E55_03505 [Pelagibacterales bacterium]|nr:hypothetical protein [Pelagibacterales bacterium]
MTYNMNEDKIRKELKICLENCNCLGRQAYGEYIDRLTEHLIKVIKEEK